MKTEQLIRVLAADGSRPVMPVTTALWRALGVGVLASTALFLLLLHPRPDVPRAIITLRFDFKLVFALSIAGTAMLFLREAALPLVPGRRCWSLLLGPVLLIMGLGVELATQPPAVWANRLVGHNAIHCLSLIPLLSLPLLAFLLTALRQAAPVRPPVAGAAAGLVASGVGSILYALTCPDDSPLFVATWYSIAILVMASVAGYIGNRLLRW